MVILTQLMSQFILCLVHATLQELRLMKTTLILGRSLQLIQLPGMMKCVHFTEVKIHAYADDEQLYDSDTGALLLDKQLTHQLNIVNKWYQSNGTACKAPPPPKHQTKHRSCVSSFGENSIDPSPKWRLKI